MVLMCSNWEHTNTMEGNRKADETTPFRSKSNNCEREKRLNLSAKEAEEDDLVSRSLFARGETCLCQRELFISRRPNALLSALVSTFFCIIFMFVDKSITVLWVRLLRNKRAIFIAYGEFALKFFNVNPADVAPQLSNRQFIDQIWIGHFDKNTCINKYTLNCEYFL